MANLLRIFYASLLVVFVAFPVMAFEDYRYVTPDTWSMHASPGQFKEMYRGIPIGDANLNLGLTSRYRLRTNDYSSDQDFYQYLRANVDSVKVGQGTMTATLFTRFADDIDGDSNRDWGDNYYYYYEDSLDKELDDNDWAPRVYQAKFEFKNVIPNTDITAGRFYLDHLNTFQMDGGDFTVSLGDKVDVYGFGGMPVSYYYDTDDDFFYGGGVKVQATETTKISGEYIRLDVEDLDDDYTKARLDQSVPYGNIAVEYTNLNSASEYLLVGNFEIPTTNTMVNVEYKTLRDEVETDNSYVVNPLTYALLPENKYNLLDLSVYQGAGDHLVFGGGYEVRAVDDSDDEDFGNRNYDRYYGNLDIIGIPTYNTYISLKADYWDVEENQDVSSNEKVQYGVEISQKISDTVDVWLGTDFSKYEYDYINDRRKDSVRMYYTGGQWEPNNIFSFLVDFSYEDSEMYDTGDLEEIYTVEAWANIVF
jgi:hypothetical protein